MYDDGTHLRNSKDLYILWLAFFSIDIFIYVTKTATLRTSVTGLEEMLLLLVLARIVHVSSRVVLLC